MRPTCTSSRLNAADHCLPTVTRPALALFLFVVSGCRERYAPPGGSPGVGLRHKLSTREQALGTAEHALLPAPAPLVGNVINVVVLRHLEQQVVARLQLVDKL